VDAEITMRGQEKVRGAATYAFERPVDRPAIANPVHHATGIRV
jgi:hypothetical protein